MHCVRHYECDAYGHVNHANYLRYMQETAFDASVKRATAVRHYTICRASDGELLAQAHVLWVWVDLESGGRFGYRPFSG